MNKLGGGSQKCAEPECRLDPSNLVLWGTPGELTMQVNVWGFVKNPGRYEVASSTDLIQLISFAGAPVQYAKLDEVKLTRLMLNDSTGAKREFIFNLEHLDKLSQSSLALYQR